MRVAHLTTVDLSLRYLVLPQLEAAAEVGQAFGISAPGPYVSEIEERGIVHVPLPASTRGMSLASDVLAMRQFWKALRQIQPDVVHTHNPKPGIYGRILARLAGVPIVMNTVHGLYATPESPWSKRVLVYALEAIASRFSDAELVQNPEDLDLLRRLRITNSSKLRLLGNGVDLDRFNPRRAREMRAAERRRLGVGGDEIVVGMVGRLVEEKGVPELIGATGHLDDNVRVLIAGPNDPEKDDAIASELLESGRVAGVEFIGMRTDIDSFYAGLDIFVLPSHREGFPRAAMEAAASGLPLVVTDIRGCRQVVDDGVNGRLVPVRDPDSLAAALTQLTRDPSLRESMGAASAAKAVEEFDEDRVVAIVMDSYRQLAHSKGLSWKMASGEGSVEIRPAMTDDARAIANLHLETIDTGFLSSLGSSFLTLLYRSLVTSDSGVVGVAADEDGTVVGFIASAVDTGAFYREFLRRHLVEAVWRLIPALFRPGTWRRIWETLRYGTVEHSDVSAELLSLAIAPVARRRGLAKRLVSTLQNEMIARGSAAIKVVVGGDNDQAIRLYAACGFAPERTIEVHEGDESLEMTWRS